MLIAHRFSAANIFAAINVVTGRKTHISAAVLVAFGAGWEHYGRIYHANYLLSHSHLLTLHLHLLHLNSLCLLLLRVESSCILLLEIWRHLLHVWVHLLWRHLLLHIWIHLLGWVLCWHWHLLLSRILIIVSLLLLHWRHGRHLALGSGSAHYRLSVAHIWLILCCLSFHLNLKCVFGRGCFVCLFCVYRWFELYCLSFYNYWWEIKERILVP